MKILSNRAHELLAIKRRKLGRSITQRDVADETGIALSTISRWFRNDIQRMDAHVVVALAEYFECDIGDLLVIEESDDEPGQRKTLLAEAWTQALVG